ncbi:Sarcolemmal membrane-associated protein [Halotydeus destructor]|nr:Sarcolemmal membrane-associated protein [Halotydeus destructor]
MRMESCGLETVQFNGDEDQEIPVTNGHTDDPYMQFDKGQNVPIAVLTSRPNSHPFNERRCSLFHPAKIGRAVAKGKPTLDNAIFDCKVLSRNHATLWYEDGKFYLQDTRSSNGTFVNSQRLSVANEESKSQEVFSVDIVRFGVDVLGNSRKVTHGCIVASLRLFCPDGSEAQPQVEDHCTSSPQGVNGSVSSHQLGNISTLNLYQLAQCLKDSLDREANLRAKFNLLKDTLAQAQVKAQSSWKSLVEEDRLLARVESLQSKLESVILSAGNKQEEELITLLRNEMIKMHEGKETYDLVARDTLWRAAEQSLLTSAKLGELEIVHKSAPEQLSRLQEDAMVKADEITRLAEKHDKTLKELEEIQEKFKDTENLLAKTGDDYKEDKFQLEEKITDLKMKEIDAENFQTSSEKLNAVLQNQVEELKQELDRLID